MAHKISFIGSGNVATNLAKGFYMAGNVISQVISRNQDHAKKLASQYGAFYGSDFGNFYNDADFIIVSVHDDAYAEILPKLETQGKAIVCHTGGATDISVFKGLGLKHGVLYPLQSFNKDRVIDLLNVPFLIESQDVFVEKKIAALAAQVSNSVHIVNSRDRLMYHLSAVFANNFTNLMYLCSERILEAKKLNASLLQPIIAETAERLKYDKAKNLQTGPAKRGDMGVINRHLDILDEPELKEIYKMLSQYLMTLP